MIIIRKRKHSKLFSGFERIILAIIFTVFISENSAAQKAKSGTFADFMGTNSNVASFDNGFLTDLSKCFKWMREYHSWAHYEATNNYYKWDDITKYPHTYTWPDHNKFMDRCNELGIQILIDALGKPTWMSSNPIPNNTGDGTNASDYMEKLEFMGQLVARYGSQSISVSKLETADKATGLNLIKYYEDENEPDYWWSSPSWPAENYAKFCNAVHDGTGVQTSTEFPLLGIKSVDPSAIHVLAGLAATDSIYIDKILKTSNGQAPFDVINMHMYCSDHTNAYSPEHETYGYEKGLANIFKWKKRNLPNMPIWITEFGWDTYLSGTGAHSYTYASFAEQANYLLRSYFIFLKMGFEKAFMFMANDGNSSNTLQYSSSGVFKDKNLNYEKKPSFYYLTTMQNVLGNLNYKKTLAYAEKAGNNEIYCFEFENPETLEKTYALWTRESNSKVDNGATTSYQLQLDEIPKALYQITPTKYDEDGDTLLLNLISSKVDLVLKETPIFLVASDNATGIKEIRTNKVELKAYPNPSHGSVGIWVRLPTESKLQLSVFSSDGKLVKTISNQNLSAGKHNFQLEDDLKGGIYFVRCQTKWGSNVERLIIMN